ncbi:MAG TPA: glycosyltransferase family 39 protein [Thermoanaerobaculia bacterium]|nr:glycosyltransferase family 39 protein [Thermoanaerobaculia bacterium]
MLQKGGRSSAARPAKVRRLTLPVINWKVMAGGLTAVGLTLLAFAVRLFPIRISHWWEEAAFLQHAEVIFSGRTNWDELALQPPFLSVLIAGAFVLRHDAVAASILLALISALCVFVIYLLGKSIYDTTVGLVAAALLTLTPYFITASHWILTDVPSTTLITVAFYLLVTATRRDSEVLYALSGAVFGAAVLTRFTSLPLVLIAPLYFVIMKIRWSRLAYVAAGFLALLIPYFAWSRIRYGFFLSTIANANRIVSEKIDPSYYLARFTDIFPLFIVVGLIIYAVAILIRVRPFSTRDAEEIVLGIRVKVDAKVVENLRSIEAVLILWIVLFLAYLSTSSTKDPRDLLPLAPPLLLLAARGYAHLLTQKNWLRVGTAALLAVLLVPGLQAAFRNLAPPYVIGEVTEAVAVSRYLVSMRSPASVVYANHDYPVLAYYTGMRTVVLPWDQSFYREYPKLMRAPGFFVFYRRVGKQPTENWLNANPAFARLREGPDIIVYRYTPRAPRAAGGESNRWLSL